MFSKTVQLSLQNKGKIVHTTHTYHIFPPVTLAHSHPVKTEQTEKKKEAIMLEYITKQKEISSVLYPKVSSPFLILGE